MNERQFKQGRHGFGSRVAKDVFTLNYCERFSPHLYPLLLRYILSISFFFVSFSILCSCTMQEL